MNQTLRALFVCLLLVTATAARATVYYVDGSKPDNNGNGKSWANAKRDLQEAIYSATASGDEVWVKAGTYLPTLDTNGLVPADGSDCTFDISFRNIKLYGGFAGTETAASQRNPAVNVTILSGDLDNSGSATAGDANTVLRTIGRSAACVIDGFTVTRGNGYKAAGMYNYNSTTTVNNCIFTANTNGSGMRNFGGGPTITNCSFTGNTAVSGGGNPGRGGGVCNYNSSVVITNSTISGNTTIAGDGAGIYSLNGSLAVTNCTISGNTAGFTGGGIYTNFNSSNGSLTVTNCTITSNTATFGGGMYSAYCLAPTFTNCTISGNTAAFYGGGMHNSYCASININGCIISGNTAATRGGGIYNENTGHTITRSVFSNNTCTGSSGGGMYNFFCQGSDINTCVFSGNICSDTTINPGNGALNPGGGGLYMYGTTGGSYVMMAHCTFYGNIASTGGGIYSELTGNNPKSMRDCILYNNTTYNATANANQEELRVVNSNGLGVSYSIIRDYSSSATNNYGGPNVSSNNGANPGLVDVTSPAGPDGRWLTADDGLRIGCSSVAKDAGNLYSSIDAIGNPIQGIPDIGAYEAQGISTAAPSTLPSATTAVSGTQTANATTYYTDCGNTIAGLLASGAAPVSGSVIAKVNVLASVPTSAGGQPYVQRTYDITPAANAATATAVVTLFFTQAEFTAYNAVRGSYPSLPVNGTDTASYRANLRITQNHGTSATGLPNSYSGSSVLITPASVTYSATAQRWEVNFPVTGFSGFFAHTASSSVPLPLKLLSFSGRAEGRTNRLTWQVAGEETGTTYTVEHSATSGRFEAFGTITGNGNDSYSFTDEGVKGSVYYRLRSTDAGGRESYSPVVLIRRSTAGSSTVTVAPVPADHTLRITNTDATMVGQQLVIYNMQGGVVYQATFSSDQSIDISGWAAGIYALRLPSGEMVRIVKK